MRESLDLEASTKWRKEGEGVGQEERVYTGEAAGNKAEVVIGSSPDSRGKTAATPHM